MGVGILGQKSDAGWGEIEKGKSEAEQDRIM